MSTKSETIQSLVKFLQPKWSLREEMFKSKIGAKPHYLTQHNGQQLSCTFCETGVAVKTTELPYTCWAVISMIMCVTRNNQLRNTSCSRTRIYASVTNTIVI